jgi:hypothetical protein
MARHFATIQNKTTNPLPCRSEILQERSGKSLFSNGEAVLLHR